MKKIFVFLFFCILGNTNAQFINGKPLADIESEYIFVSGVSKNVGTKVFVEIDFGQSMKVSLLKNDEPERMMDSTGNLMGFNSMISIINFFTSKGYEYVQGFGVLNSGPWNPTQLKVLFRKKKTVN